MGDLLGLRLPLYQEMNLHEEEFGIGFEKKKEGDYLQFIILTSFFVYRVQILKKSRVY